MTSRLPVDEAREVPTHLLIARACEDDPRGGSVEVKQALYREPTEGEIETARSEIVRLFEWGQERSPTRVAVVVLPYIADEDDDPSSDGQAQDV